jgi:REP element-mobilizing transposase RayT
MTRPPVILTRAQRAAVEEGIRELCRKRKWGLWALNARSNHVHIVVTADLSSKAVRSAIKAAGTKGMRKRDCWRSVKTPWGGGGSRRKVWTDDQLQATINYVMYDQGE